MKKIAILFLAVIFLSSTPSYSFEFKKLTKEEKEVKSLLKEHNKALYKKDLETLSTFYHESYKNEDGYNLSEMIAMIEKATKAFENIKYKTKIINIEAREQSAIAQMQDTTKAKIYPFKKFKNRDKIGILEGKSNCIVYLNKIDNEWKIIKDATIEEETSLRYGIARKIDLELKTPESIKNGQNYELALNMETPEKIIAIGSISREEVNFPPDEYEEKFRKIPQDGILERLVKANDKNKDEYAIASVGFTKVSLNEKEKKAKIEILGMAYMMKRIAMRNFSCEEVENN